MKKILFPTDFSPSAQNAFRYALRIADATGASIEILHAVYPEFESMDLPAFAAQATKEKAAVARELLTAFVDTGIAQVQATYQFKEVPDIHADLEIGGATNLICKIAERDEADLILMGTKGEHNALEKLLGSVSAGVIEKAKTPVLLIPEAATFTSPSNLIFATDLNEADPMHLWRIAKLLEPLKPIIRCIHIHQEKEKEKPVNMNDFKSFLESRDITLQITFHEMEEDDVALGIQEFAELHRADMIIMFKPRLPFMDRIFHLSATRRVALHSHLPLLIVK